MARWTEKQFATLKLLAAQEVPLLAISAKLRKSESAVRQKANRAKLKISRGIPLPELDGVGRLIALGGVKLAED